MNQKKKTSLNAAHSSFDHDDYIEALFEEYHMYKEYLKNIKNVKRQVY